MAGDGSMTDDKTHILGCDLVQTSTACPEQYDVFLGDERVGYLRLRHGVFRADYPDCGGETVYEAEPEGDGCFVDAERDFHLTQAVTALLSRHQCVS